MNITIPGVNSFGGTGYNGTNYMNTFNSWGIGGSPDVPSISPGDGATQLVDPAVYANPNGIADAANGDWATNAWDKFTSLPWLNSKNAQGIEQQGILSPAISGLSSIANGYLAMKQLGLAQDQFNFQKDAFTKNWAAKKATTNSALEDRQRARVASNSGAYQSVGDYMNQYGIK